MVRKRLPPLPPPPAPTYKKPLLKRIAKRVGIGLTVEERERNYQTRLTTLKRKTELEKQKAKLVAEKMKQQRFAAKGKKSGSDLGQRMMKASNMLGESLAGSGEGIMGGSIFDQPKTVKKVLKRRKIRRTAPKKRKKRYRTVREYY